MEEGRLQSGLKRPLNASAEMSEEVNREANVRSTTRHTPDELVRQCTFDCMPARAARERTIAGRLLMNVDDYPDPDGKSTATIASVGGEFGERIEDLTDRRFSATRPAQEP
jgi:hypothetical protein